MIYFKNLQKKFIRFIADDDKKILFFLANHKGMSIYKKAYQERIFNIIKHTYVITSKILGEDRFNHILNVFIKIYVKKSNIIIEVPYDFYLYTKNTSVIKKISLACADMINFEFLLMCLFDRNSSSFQTHSTGKFNLSNLHCFEYRINPALGLFASNYDIVRIWTNPKVINIENIHEVRKSNFWCVKRENVNFYFYALDSNEYYYLTLLLQNNSFHEYEEKLLINDIRLSFIYKYVEKWFNLNFFTLKII